MKSTRKSRRDTKQAKNKATKNAKAAVKAAQFASSVNSVGAGGKVGRDFGDSAWAQASKDLRTDRNNNYKLRTTSKQRANTAATTAYWSHGNVPKR